MNCFIFATAWPRFVVESRRHPAAGTCASKTGTVTRVSLCGPRPPLEIIGDDFGQHRRRLSWQAPKCDESLVHGFRGSAVDVRRAYGEQLPYVRNLLSCIVWLDRISFVGDAVISSRQRQLFYLFELVKRSM